MNMSASRELKGDLLEFFCRHLIALCVSYRHRTDEDTGQPERFAACSGTLIMIDGILFFLTAGHVLQKLEDLRCSDRAEIVSAVFADTLGWKRISDIPVPFDLKKVPLFYIDEDKEGLDFGVIVIEPHYARLIAKNGMVALTEEQWAHQDTGSFDGYAVLGLPGELTSGRVTASGAGFVAPTMLGLERLQSAAVRRPVTRYPQFIGRLGSEQLHSLEGMSGGPIFGFRYEPDQNCRYWIVALQSSWHRPTRTVYGCSLPVIASLMTEGVRGTSPPS